MPNQGLMIRMLVRLKIVKKRYIKTEFKSWLRIMMSEYNDAICVHCKFFLVTRFESKIIYYKLQNVVLY